MNKQPRDSKADGNAIKTEDGPNELLATKVLEELVKADLIEPDEISRRRNKLATGGLNSTDWRMVFENRIERRTKPAQSEGEAPADLRHRPSTTPDRTASAADLVALTITNLRGYANTFRLNFERGKKLCIVYGENGTGKTTLCDSLELLGSGTVGSLDGRGLGQTQKYWHPAGAASTSGEVELETKDVTYKATVTGGAVSWASDQKPRVQVLRRPQLLQIVTAAPAKRYEAIADLVDVADVEQSEQALANLLKEVERDSSQQTARIAGAQEVLHNLFASAAGVGTDPVEWARQEVQRDVSVVEAEANTLKALSTAFERLENQAAKCNAAREALGPLYATARAADDALAAPAGDSSAADAQVLELLEAASRTLAGHASLAACPVCESAERAQSLVSRIGERLAAMKELRALRTRQEAAGHELEAGRTRLIQAENDYRKEHTAVLDLLANLQLGELAPQDAPPVDTLLLAGWLDRTRATRQEWETKQRKLMARAEQLGELRGAIKAYDENYALAVRSSALRAALESGLNCAKATRHTFVNLILEDIAAEAKRLYEAVHPGEMLSEVSLNLAPNKRASLDLFTTFLASPKVPPQAYYSDSHLDTLGLCVFIALAKRSSPAATIMVLDDVLASVDEPHVDRLIEMIYDEAQHFLHLIVTTHYRPWREKIRWGWLRQGQCQVVEFGRWTAGSGPSLVRSTGEFERLRKLLDVPEEAFDAQAACAKAGVILEALLDFLTELYQSSLPRKPRNEWTLGDLLPAVKKKLRDALRVEHQSTADPQKYDSYPLGPVIEELQRIAQTRNLQGAHFNKLSFALLDSDAKHFATKVLELADLIVHPELGWPRNDKSGSYWATAKDARRLHPLKEPS